MAETTYPVFEAGQTLTAADLNQVRGFLHDRDRLLGRLVGFGVACGLEGTVSGGTLTIGPGLAVDQVGEPLVVGASRTVALPPTASGEAFDVVAGGPGGFSVVLEAGDTVVPAPDCGDADCEGHAEQHTRDVALHVVAGRVTGSRFDFAAEPLLGVEPLRLSLTSAVQGSYVTLRDTLVGRLTNGGAPLVDPALITRLQGTSIAGDDLPGARGYKAGFLNQVLFATLDLLRCRSLHTVSCERPTARPAVVLGWLEAAGGGWQWHCRYRHAWEPPPGLSQALVGGACTDVCGPFVDALEGLLAGYAPPDRPPAGGGGGGGGVVVVPDDFHLCRKGQVFSGGRCVNVFYPPPEVPELWYEPWLELDPRVPVWNPPDERFETQPSDIYETFGWEYFGNDVISVVPAVGATKESVADSLTTVVTGTGRDPHVVFASADDVAKTPGYEPAGSVNPADTIVMTVDAGGTVLATGRVPGGYTAQRIGTQLPAAVARADVAVGRADQALETVTEQVAALQDVTQEVSGLRGDMDDVRGFQQTTLQWKDQVDQALAGVDGLVDERVDERVDAVLDSTLTDLGTRMTRMEASVDVLTKVRPGVGPVAGGTAPPRLGQDVAHGMVEFAETVSAGLQTLVTDDNRRTLGRYVAEAGRAQATLEEAAAGGEPAEIGDATVRLLGALRTAVKAAGVDPEVGRQLDARFDAVRGLVG